MSYLSTVPIFGFLLISSIFIATASAATFTVKNNCRSTMWAAAVPGGSQEMPHGAIWTVTSQPGTTKARIWARTSCTPSGANGLHCQTGDCNGLFHCTDYGTAPNTLAEYTLNGYANLDYFDVSVVAGFNVPMTFVPVDSTCTSAGICNADVTGQCPSQLKAPGGCNNPCTVFNTDQYCCTSGGPCGPTNYSRYFKNLCPKAYSYPKDDPTSLVTCPTGTNYAITFCP